MRDVSSDASLEITPERLALAEQWLNDEHRVGFTVTPVIVPTAQGPVEIGIDVTCAEKRIPGEPTRDSIGGWRVRPTEGQKGIVATLEEDESTPGGKAFTNRVTGQEQDTTLRAIKSEAYKLTLDMEKKWRALMAILELSHGQVADWSAVAEFIGGHKSVTGITRPDIYAHLTPVQLQALFATHALNITLANSYPDGTRLTGKGAFTAPDFGTGGFMNGLTDQFKENGLPEWIVCNGDEPEPSPATAIGVVWGIRGMLDALGIDGSTLAFVVQGGFGAVGKNVIMHLYHIFPGAIIYASDQAKNEKDLVEFARSIGRDRVSVIHPGDEFHIPSWRPKFFVPSAVPSVLNAASLRAMQRAEFIGVGGPANSIWTPGDPGIMHAFFAAGIPVATAYVINSGGIAQAMQPLIPKNGGRRQTQDEFHTSLRIIGDGVRYLVSEALRRKDEPNMSPELIAEELVLRQTARMLIKMGVIN